MSVDERRVFCLRLCGNCWQQGAANVMLTRAVGWAVPRRWAGHSKWQNIKHTKAANDAARAKLFTKLSRMIGIAIAEGGSSSPESNLKLQQVIEQAKKANMPHSTIANCIKAGSGAKGSEKAALLHVRGPGRSSFLVEILAVHPERTSQQLTQLLRKHKCQYDRAALMDFTQKGILISEVLAAGFEQAVDDAITSGLEEVVQLEESSKVQFECSPGRLFQSKQELERLGYRVDSAVVEFIPHRVVELGDADLELCAKFLTKMEEVPEVVRVIDNIS